MGRYQLGHRDRVAGEYEVSRIGVTLKYRKTSHPELLDIEIEAADFADKRGAWHESKMRLYARLEPYIKEGDPADIEATDLLLRMDKEDQDAWTREFLDLKSNLTSADVEPVFGFIDEHILEVEGVLDRAGEAVTKWHDLPAGDRAVLMGDIPPHEIAAIYTAIRKTIALGSDQKKG